MAQVPQRNCFAADILSGPLNLESLLMECEGSFWLTHLRIDCSGEAQGFGFLRTITSLLLHRTRLLKILQSFLIVFQTLVSITNITQRLGLGTSVASSPSHRHGSLR